MDAIKMVGGFNVEWWHALIGLSLFAISAALNLLTLFKYLSSALRMRGFFPGRWQGLIQHDTGQLYCVMVLYLEDGQLTGLVYYDGRYGCRENVMGFDQLRNDSGDLRCAMTRFGIGQSYEACFRRSVDSYRQNGDRYIDSDTIDYTYKFDVIDRFRYKRLSCTVTTKGIEGANELTFTGELTRAK